MTFDINADRQSTATFAQYARIITMLRQGERSTIELRRAGVIHPAMRIKELNEKFGFQIPRVDLRNLWDEEGYMHKRIAIYALHAEPETVGAA